MNTQIAIIFCIEKGSLEDQAILLAKSIREFSNSDVKLVGYSPRKNNQVSSLTLNEMGKLDVELITEYINTEYLDYPIANKVLACSHFEKNYPGFDSILFVDTDTIFLNKIDNSLIKKKPSLFLRPVDNKGPGSEGFDDVNDEFWQQVFELFKMSLPNQYVNTTVGQSSIRPYYNAGFIWANRLPGFFQQWEKDFFKLVDSGLRPFGYKSRDNNDFRCLDQVALAVTAHRYRHKLEILPQTYNYPIPFRPKMIDRPNHPKFSELVHVHYHKWFQHPGFLDHVTTDEDKESEQYKWLKEHLPLLPEIDGPFKC